MLRTILHTSVVTRLLLSVVFLFSISNGQIVLDHTFSFQPHASGTAHDLKADRVVLKDKQTIEIEGLHYDGKGPDAYFMVGYGTPPIERPSEAPGHKIPNENGNCDILKGYNGKTITLTLPANYTIGGSQSNSIEWLAIYCITYKHNFGHVRISKNVELPDYNGSSLPMDCGQMGTLPNCGNNGFLFLGIICLTFIGQVF